MAVAALLFGGVGGPLWAGCGHLVAIGSHGVTTPDVALAEPAARQHGVVTRAQLAEPGFGAGAIRYRRQGRSSPPPSPRGYAVGHRPPSPLATAMAAVLACGPDAALSHGPAGAPWRIVPRCPDARHRAERARPARHPRPPLAPSRHHHPLRHRSHHPGPHARRPRRRPPAESAHASPQRGPGPTTHHPRRADHPPHPIPRPAHPPAHARAGRHPLTILRSRTP